MLFGWIALFRRWENENNFLGFLFIVIHEIFMGKEDSALTNITMQTFASEGDIALVDQRWEKDGPAF